MMEFAETGWLPPFGELAGACRSPSPSRCPPPARKVRAGSLAPSFLPETLTRLVAICDSFRFGSKNYDYGNVRLINYFSVTRERLSVLSRETIQFITQTQTLSIFKII